MSLHIGDYLRKTTHLRAAGHGAYLLLIIHYWSTGGLPNDDDQLAAIARMSSADWRKMRPTIQKFFEDGWKHERIEEELVEAQKKYEARVQAGRKGGKAKARDKQNPSNATAKSYQPITDTPSEKERETRAREPLVSREAISLTEEIAQSHQSDIESPEFIGLPMLVQSWFNEKIPRDFILATCARLRGKHLNYLDKAVRNSWADRKSDQQNRPSNAAAKSSSLTDAVDQHIEFFRRHDGDREAGEAAPRLLSNG